MILDAIGTAVPTPEELGRIQDSFLALDNVDSVTVQVVTAVRVICTAKSFALGANTPIYKHEMAVMDEFPNALFDFSVLRGWNG